MSLPCQMDPERDRQSSVDIAAKIKREKVKRKRQAQVEYSGAFAIVKRRLDRLEAIVSEQAILLQALIDRRSA